MRETTARSGQGSPQPSETRTGDLDMQLGYVAFSVPSYSQGHQTPCGDSQDLILTISGSVLQVWLRPS